MNTPTAVFDEYIFENTIEDFSNYIFDHLHLKNLNEDMLYCNELLFDVSGDT